MRHSKKPGFSLLELLAVITILGIIAAMAMSRVSAQALDAKKKCCLQFQSDLNGAIERYHFDQGSFPAQLSDLYGEYYPNEIPSCPVDGAAYSIDPTSHRIQGHSH